MKFFYFLLRRLIWLVPVIIVVTVTVFFISRILPGNPVYLMIGSRQVSNETIERLTRELGLDKPIFVQYMIYVRDLAQGDLGTAWHTSNPVTKDIFARFPATIELTIVALLIAVLIGIPLGVVAAVHKDSIIDHSVRLVSLLGLSFPSFWLGLIFLYFLAFQLDIFPSPMGRIALRVPPPEQITGLYILDSLITGNLRSLTSSVQHILLPAFTLALAQIAGISRMVRSTMIEVLESDYIRTARAFGINEKKINYSFALKNTLIPTITFVADSVLLLLGGVVVIEIIFSWPGLGLYAMESIFVKDYAGVQGVVLLMALISVLVYLSMDILYFVVDPRVKY